MDKDKKYFLACFLAPFAVALTFYYVIAIGVSTHFFHQPAPKPETLLKYTISRLADYVGFDYLYFSLPEEYENVIRKDFHNPTLQRVPVKSYHVLLDGDGAPPPHPFFYTFFLII